MTRIFRILKSADNATAVAVAAPPPEAVALESDFVVILAALLCALICVVGLVAVARCAWLRRGPPGGGNSPRQAVVNKGLKKKVLQSLPRFAYADSNPSKWVATSECAICLGDFTAGDEIRVLPQCGHGFHVSCIDRWLGSHSSCPSCRQVLAVARCQKCGRFPATAGRASRSGASEPELKSGEDSNAASISNCSNNNSDGGGSGNHANHHHSHHSNSGFLP